MITLLFDYSSVTLQLGTVERPTQTIFLYPEDRVGSCKAAYAVQVRGEAMDLHRLTIPATSG